MSATILASALLAAGFVNPLLLGGLGLAALPIVIHLLSRRQYRRIEWGATRFLLEAEKENRRRVRFEQWLLLALRCAAMALLALLVSRPFVQPGVLASLLGSRGAVQRILVLDDSASLDYRAGGSSDFGRVRGAAQRLISWLQQEAPGEPLTVYRASAPAEPIVRDAALSESVVRDVRAKLERLAPTATRAQGAAVFATIADALAATGRGRRADVYVISDFQKTDWTPAGAAVFAPLTRIEGDALRVILISAASSARDNSAISEVRFERPQTMAGLPAVVQARVVNGTTRTLSGLSLAIELDGAVQPGAPIEPIGPGDERLVAAEVTFPGEGDAVLTVALSSPDGLAADDRYRLAVRVKPILPVLLVNGQPGADEAGDEVRLLRSALAPPGPLSSGIRVDVIDADELEATPLESYDCVFVCNLPPPSEAAADALARGARRGGGLVLFLGGEVGQPADYNRLFYRDGDGLLPLPLDAQVNAPPRSEGVALLRSQPHPVTAMFPGDADSLAGAARFRSYFRVREGAAGEPAPPGGAAQRPPATVLARFADGDQTPALVERPYGRGRVLLFASSADLEWNDWARAIDGSYVVTMLELAQYAARRDAATGATLGGEALALALWPDEYDLSVQFQSPRYPDDPAVPGVVTRVSDTGDEPTTVSGPRAVELGVYRARLSPRAGGVEERPLAVNLDPAESNLQAAGEAELRAALGGLNVEYIGSAEAFLAATEASRRELWPTLLLLVIAILMTEQALAWWFGTPRRARTAPLAGIQTLRRPA